MSQFHQCPQPHWMFRSTLVNMVERLSLSVMDVDIDD